jgi:GTPase SAR1 family protein
MFDITRKASFDALDMWLREASKNGGENLPVFVVGNKSDLAGNRKV